VADWLLYLNSGDKVLHLRQPLHAGREGEARFGILAGELRTLRRSVGVTAENGGKALEPATARAFLAVSAAA
jgi:hypothetical protein